MSTGQTVSSHKTIRLVKHDSAFLLAFPNHLLFLHVHGNSFPKDPFCNFPRDWNESDCSVVSDLAFCPFCRWVRLSSSSHQEWMISMIFQRWYRSGFDMSANSLSILRCIPFPNSTELLEELNKQRKICLVQPTPTDSNSHVTWFYKTLLKKISRQEIKCMILGWVKN